MSFTKPPPPKNHCEDPASLLHTLDCEHVVKTSISSSLSPTTAISATPATTSKAPCSPNCTRSIYTSKPQIPLSWLRRRQNLHAHLFTCPVCVEEYIRSQYARCLEEHTRKGGRVTDNVETNVQIWTYEAVLEAVERGGRISEGVVGVFRIKYLEGFRSLGRGQKKDGGYETWALRGRTAGAYREGKTQTVVDDKDASEESLIGGENNDEVRVGDVEMEDLADRVTDARIDIQQDHAVDTLMEGLSRL